MRPRGSILLVTAIAALVSGCGHAPGYPPDPTPRPTAVTDFATLYGQNCAACHGANGQNGPAIDLANPEYQALVDDATLRKWISGGMPGTEMPAFAQSQGGMLTDAQVNALVAGMRQLWSRPNAFGSFSTIQNGKVVTAQLEPPPYAQDQAGDAKRGERVYGDRCAGCHLKPQKQQITSANYLSLMSDQALRTIIIAGRPDIGQPDLRLGPTPLPGEGPVVLDYLVGPPLSAGEVDDIVSYLASLRNTSPQVAANTAPSQSASTPADGRKTK